MNEAEWLAPDDPMPMLQFLEDNGKLSERKARLFAAACRRRVWGWLTHDKSRRAIEVAERFADAEPACPSTTTMRWPCRSHAPNPRGPQRSCPLPCGRTPREAARPTRTACRRRAPTALTEFLRWVTFQGM
jgi:hypothetical protein